MFPLNYILHEYSISLILWKLYLYSYDPEIRHVIKSHITNNFEVECKFKNMDKNTVAV